MSQRDRHNAASDSEHDDRGITERQWLEGVIHILYIDTGRIPASLALSYAKLYGVEAERNLIRSILASSK